MNKITFKQAIHKIYDLAQRRGWNNNFKTHNMSVNCLNGKNNFKTDVICINIYHPEKFKKYWDLVKPPFTREDIIKIDRMLLDKIVENIPELVGIEVSIHHYKFDGMTDNTTDERFSVLTNRNFYITKF